MILVKLEKLLWVLLERNVISKIQNYDVYFLLYPTFLSRQQDNDDENDTDTFSRTDKHKNVRNATKKNSLYTMSRSELQITVSHQLSAAIRLLLISVAIGYFAQGSYLER